MIIITTQYQISRKGSGDIQPKHHLSLKHQKLMASLEFCPNPPWTNAAGAAN